MQSSLHLQLSLSLILFLAFLPSFNKVFEKSYHPIIRKPIDHSLRDLLALICAAFAYTILYSVTGGSLEVLIKSTTNPSEHTLKTSALLGSFTFASARIWAMYKSHTIAESIYYSALMILATFISIGIISSETATQISDGILKRENDDLTLLPIAFSFSVIAAGTSELLSFIGDRFVIHKKCIPYSLVRSQLEVFENYPRLRNMNAFCWHLDKSFQAALGSTRKHKNPIPVIWLTTNASEKVFNVVKKYCPLGHSKTADFSLRVISHDTDNNRFVFNTVNDDFKRFSRFDGSTRLLIIGDRIAYLGIQIGEDRHKENPDYILIIEEPTRISRLKTMFEECWKSI